MPLQGLGRPQLRLLTPLPLLRVAYSTLFVEDLLRSYQAFHQVYCVTVMVTRGVGSSVGR